MKKKLGLPTKSTPADKDLAEQARPGHGIPSQDPDPAAQVGLARKDAKRETESVLIGGGVVAGAHSRPETRSATPRRTPPQ
jgi:hypothetical protein